MKNLTKVLIVLLITVVAISCTKEGPAGKDGNANVYYSDWQEAGTWTGTLGAYYVDKAESKITQATLDSSLVLAYAKLTSDGTNVRPLPANTSGVLWNYILTVGNIQYTSTLSGTPATSNKFRYIIVPASKHLRLAKPYSKMTYEEICTTFNIPQ